MSVDRTPRDHFSSDRELANRSLKMLLEFCLDNEKYLVRIRDQQKLADFIRMLNAGEDFTPAQRGAVEGLYETIMKNAGYPGCSGHHDKKARGLRYGT